MTDNIVIRSAKSHERGTLSDLAFRSKASHGYSPEFMEACRAERPALDHAGIQYFVKNEFATIGARAATGADELSLMVAAAHVDQASRLITEILRAHSGD